MLHNFMHLHIIFIHIYDTAVAVNSIHLCNQTNLFFFFRSCFYSLYKTV